MFVCLSVCVRVCVCVGTVLCQHLMQHDTLSLHGRPPSGMLMLAGGPAAHAEPTGGQRQRSGRAKTTVEAEGVFAFAHTVCTSVPRYPVTARAGKEVHDH